MELALFRRQNLITKQELQSLQQITSIIPTARPILMTHKNPLKVRLMVSTVGLVFYKISKLVSKELKTLLSQGKSHILKIQRKIC